jgi:hypothetical protein
VNGLAVAAVEARDIRPEILDSNREQNSSGFDLCFVAQANLERLARQVDCVIDDAIDEVNAELCALRSSERAELGRANALVAEVAVYAAGFPIARITGIDDYDFVEIASEPERST